MALTGAVAVWVGWSAFTWWAQAAVVVAMLALMAALVGALMRWGRGYPARQEYEEWLRYPFWFRVTVFLAWPATVALAWGIPWMIGVRWPFQYGRLTLPLLFVTYAVALDRLVLPHIEPREPPANASHSTSI